MFDRAALARALAAHGRVARVVVAGVQGSAPREVGAAMLVWADVGTDGGQEGTIGGGALEYQAAAAARQMLAHGTGTGTGTGARLDSIPLGPNLGQCCGGVVHLGTEIFDSLPADGHGFARPLRAQAGPMPLAMARALAGARRGQPFAVQLHQGWLIEPLTRPAAQVWIWGAGHVGRALVGVMAPLPDMAITWVDTDMARFPSVVMDGVRALPVPDMARAVALAPKGAHHVIVTFSHVIDLGLCDALLRHGFASLGLIGSASKWARFRARLAELGHAPAEISRITCPIGDPSLGKHPQAIAIGVASAMMGAVATVPNQRKEARA